MEIKKLKDLCIGRGEYGIAASAEPFSESKYRYLRITDISDNGTLLYDDPKSVSCPGCEKYILQENDIVFARTGNSTGRAFFYEPKYGELVYAGFLIKFHLDETKVNPKFLKYYTISQTYRNWVNNGPTGSTRGNMSEGDFADMPVFLPTRKQQDAIVNMFSPIDDKIENNNAICADLEGMAKLLYDYWFVQFDFPDENGKPYKSSGGKMVWNEELKREIPEGWGVSSLAAMIKASKNGDWGNESPQGQNDIKVTCFRGADFSSITSDYSLKAPTRYIKKTNESRLLKDGDLVVEISGGSPTQSTGRIGYINSSFLKRTPYEMVCSNFCKAFSLVDTTMQFWFYQTWQRYYDAGAMFHYESKTTGIKNLMFDEFVSEVKVPVPQRNILQKYAEITNTFYEKIQESFIESAELASLRDFLLPMLMNGQVKVKGA